MAWNRNVCSFHHSPYFKPEMEPKRFQRKVYTVAHLADRSCYWNPAYNGRFHVQRDDPFQARIIISTNQGRRCFCQRYSYGFRLLWICTDVASSWLSLGDGKRTSYCRKMVASWELCSCRRVWRICFHTAGNRVLYVPAKSVVFFDFEEPLIFFLADYTAVMALFVWMSHYFSKGLKYIIQKRKTE